MFFILLLMKNIHHKESTKIILVAPVTDLPSLEGIKLVVFAFLTPLYLWIDRPVLWR